METVLITGGTGLIGSRLAAMLQDRGYRVALLSRTARARGPVPVYRWNPARGTIDPEAVDTADYIIHLAGAGIADRRWTAARKRVIVDSRVATARLLFGQVPARNRALKAFISASGTGYYGSVTTDHVFVETDPPAGDFTGTVCRAWETEARRFAGAGIRTVAVRSGIVLATGGGALPRLALPVRMGLGAAIGSGRQYVPWIHIDDLCRFYLKALEDASFAGAYNAVAPQHVTQQAFMQALARVLRRPLWLPRIPAWVMKTAFGEMAGILLQGSRVSPEKITHAGFRFEHPELEQALAGLLAGK